MSNPELVPELLEKICDQLVSLNDKTDANTQQLVSLNERVDANTQQLVSLNERVDANTQQLVSLNERVDGLNERVDALDTRFKDHREFVEHTNKLRNENEVRLMTELKEIGAALKAAAQHRSSPTQLSSRLDDYERRLEALERSRPGGAL